MDLSLKKNDAQVPEDLPQDLSVKKPRSSGRNDHHYPQQTRLPSRPEKTNSVFEPRSGMMAPLVESKSKVVPSLMGQKSTSIPGLEQCDIQDLLSFSPFLSNEYLRALAHSKTKTSNNVNRKPAVDKVRVTSLVVPKPSALVIPDPKNRTVLDHRTKQESKSHGGSNEKLKASSALSLEEAQRKQLLDLRKNYISHTITERLLSNDLHQNDYMDKDIVRSLQAHVSRQSPASSVGFPLMSADSVAFFQASALPPCSESSSPLTLMEEERGLSKKRRRKQECPRKRIKPDLRPPEEEDSSIYTISEEFLDKVTDAAQKGELRKGLDEYFAQTTRRLSEVVGKRDVEESAEKAVDEELKEIEDNADNDGSSSPASSGDGPSPFQFPTTPPSQKLKGKASSRVTVTSLQTREERKALRLYGKEYTTPSGKIYPQRQVQTKDCSRCRYNCSSSISPEQRQALFDHFWSLDSYVKRLYYYCQSIKEKPAKTMKHTRECSREYTFLVDGNRVRVCKGYYLATLDVSDKAVRIAMEKRKLGKGMWDKRGGHPPHSKLRPEEKDRVRSHIESVLIMDIYSKTGNGSPGTVPGQDLNVTQMHEDYVQSCQEDGKEPVAEDVYRETFRNEYNLSTVQV
ncbi:hypothetical protein ACOMHN_051369 [Nucella lapillus]